MNLEYGVDGAILTEMASEKCEEIDEGAHVAMKIVNPNSLSVSVVEKGSLGPIYKTHPLLEKGKLRRLNIEQDAMECLGEFKVIKGHPVLLLFLCYIDHFE